ncbi:hypothetical protein [Mycolicibacterium brisbanense]
MIGWLRWMLALPPADRVRCGRDLAAATLRGGLGRELRSWRETAAIAAAGLGKGDAEWMGDGDDVVVERP